MEASSRSPSTAGRFVAPFAPAPTAIRLAGRSAESLVTAAGAGYFRYDGLAVTRWAGDETRDGDGVFVFVRDLDDGRFWSAGRQPAGVEAQEFGVEFAPGRAAFRRVDDGVRVEMEVCIALEGEVELRRIKIANDSGRRRRLEITSYLEWVLQDAAADASHPAFSKLFVETEIVPERQLILARRRAREPEQPILAGAHWIAHVEGADDRPAQFETSRMAFIGRGRSLRAPSAMDGPGPLSGAAGPVLDPIASVRRSFCLQPNESATITLALAARRHADELFDLTAPMSREAVSDAFLRADQRAAVGGGDMVTAVQAAGPTPLVVGRRLDAPHDRRGGAPDDFRPLREPPTTAADGQPLQFDNGFGGFSPRGDEYVIRLRPDDAGRLRLPPLAWSHVVANPQAGFIATETGAGYTWTANSRENRLTHWSNDPVCDPHSEAIYLRDRDSQAFWSPTPGPAGPNVVHEVRYGFGYALYDQTSAELAQRVEVFVPQDEPLKIVRLRVENLSLRPRRLDVFFYAHLALGNGARGQARGIRTWFDAEAGCAYAVNDARELAHRVTFVALTAPGAGGPTTFTGDRAEFLGRNGELSAPLAVRSARPLSGRAGSGLDPCAALQTTLTLAGGETAECWALIGEADNEAKVHEFVGRYARSADVDAAAEVVRRFWTETLSAVEIDTPSAAMNLMVNGWLPYQNLSCRMWGRSAYYQSGGAYGFRDQLQDSAALVYHWPELTRKQILRHAASQFVEGDVLHWWHTPGGRGIRTRFADDLLWLPLLAAEYCQTTGDADLWDEPAPYLTGPALDEGEAERFIAPTRARESGSIYEHACRAIDRSLAVGAHGLPLFGCGDWNDGMNRVGRLGRGESVWMGFFLYHVLDRMIPVCIDRGERRRADHYREHQTRLRAALNGPGWDGHWFRRAFFDDGTPLGSEAGDECQIDALVQAWAVLSGAGDAEFARKGMSAVERRLVCNEGRLIRLLDPPFDRMTHDPGYIKGYLRGIRENGGQYTHGVLWFVRALAEMGRGSRAVELLDILNPINHARTPQEVAVYQAEPYVVAADVYSQPPHVGRAGWTWYTGSAGWMFRVAVESILGLAIRGGSELVLNPCISADWPRCRLRYRLPEGGGNYEIVIENPDGRETGVHEGRLDGEPVKVVDGTAVVPLAGDGRDHRIWLRL